jgi:hypothetical protein
MSCNLKLCLKLNLEFGWYYGVLMVEAITLVSVSLLTNLRATLISKVCARGNGPWLEIVIWQCANQWLGFEIYSLKVYLCFI